ncbi:hypothetical protein WP5S18E05_31700 [Klebsiella quasipneumoniae]|nr:hypothetical protein WP5S18E05_31700 [Klebsiella quasipneumoniae]
MINLEQIKADIAARKAMPAWGAHTSIERIKTINATLPSFSLKTVEALVEALDYYKSREERVTKLVLDNSASWDELYQQLEAKGKRNAELESRTVTVKMPKLKMLEDYLAEVAVEERKAILLGVRMEFHRALTAAGIKVEVGSFRKIDNSSTVSFREIPETSTEGGNQ